MKLIILVVCSLALTGCKSCPKGEYSSLFSLAMDANDSRDPTSARLAVSDLFRLYVKPGMTLSKVGAMLEGAEWLQDDDVAIYGALAGSIPVDLTANDTTFCIYVIPKDKTGITWIFLRVSGEIEKDQILLQLRGKDKVKSRAKLKEFAIFEGGRLARVLYHSCGHLGSQARPSPPPTPSSSSSPNSGPLP